MLFQVEYLGGPDDGKKTTLNADYLPDYLRVFIPTAMTKMTHDNQHATDCVERFGVYHLKPMVRDGARFYMYVYDDSLEEFEKRYAS